MGDFDRELDAEHPEVAATLKSMNWDERLQEARARRETVLKRKTSDGKRPVVRIIDAAAVAQRRALDESSAGTAPARADTRSTRAALLPALAPPDPEPEAGPEASPTPAAAPATAPPAGPARTLAARTALGFGLGAGLGLGLVLGAVLVVAILGSGSMPDTLRAERGATSPPAAEGATPPPPRAAPSVREVQAAEPLVASAAPPSATPTGSVVADTSVAMATPPAVVGDAPAAPAPGAGDPASVAPPASIALTAPVAVPRVPAALPFPGAAPETAPTAGHPAMVLASPAAPATLAQAGVQTRPAAAPPMPPAAIAGRPDATAPRPVQPHARAEARFDPPQPVIPPRIATVLPPGATTPSRLSTGGPQVRPAASAPGLGTLAAPRPSALALRPGPSQPGAPRPDTRPRTQIALARPDVPGAASGFAAPLRPEQEPAAPASFAGPFPVIESAQPVALTTALPGLAPDPLPPLDTTPGVAVPGAEGLFVRVALPRTAPEEELSRISAVLGGAGIEIGSVDSVPYRISESHLRYFHPEDAGAAAVLGGVLNLEVRDFTRFRPPPPNGMIEVFVAGDRMARAPMPARPATPQRATPQRAASEAAVTRRTPSAVAAPRDPVQALQNRIVERLRRGEHLR